MQKEDCFELGWFAKTHGYKGELTLKLDVDNPQQYKKLESVFVEINKKLVPFYFENYQLTPSGMARVKIEGIQSDERAQKMVRKSVFLPLNLLPKLKGKAFYYHEIKGYTAIDTEFDNIGIIQEVMDGHAQDLFRILKDQKEILIPVLDDFIVSIDREKKEILLNAPEGIIEFYLSN